VEKDHPMTSGHALEVARGERFEFGANWTSFLATVDQRRIDEAERSMCELLEQPALGGQRFLDIGCGSGLFSLAAHRLGATVHSLDFDPQSVRCTRALRERLGGDDCRWTIEEGSVLDAAYLRQLGQFDIVYSWGVLHHTGDMWRAIDLAAERVAPGGTLAIALYNLQGVKSRMWRRVKRFYCSGRIARAAVSAAFMPYFAARGVCTSLFVHRNPIRYFTEYKSMRGMSVAHDWKDWLGGYPYDAANPGRVLAALRARGFILVSLHTVSGLGNNQYVFHRPA
jgi:2-polyprenyl-3-methyl-5-hydroxy-6-metoxy-1,4-benzoquinol methylase